MMHGCSWCLSPDHVLRDCTKVEAFRVATTHGVVDPMHDEDPQDQLAQRCFQLRAVVRGLIAEMRALGHEPSQVTKDLIPANEGLDL